MIGNTNGFALMGVKPEDNLATINERLAALGANYQEVYQRLTDPSQRLKEEVRYFTGDITMPTKLDLPWHLLNNLSNAKDAASFAKGYKMIMDDLQDLDYDALVEAVNENRVKAGFPAVSLEEVQAAAAGMDQEVGLYLVAMAQKRGIGFYAEVVNTLMNTATSSANVFINAFPEYAKAFCKVQNGRINSLLTGLAAQPDFNKIEDLDNILSLRTNVLGTLKAVLPTALKEINSYYPELINAAQGLINNNQLIYGRALLECVQFLYGEANLIPADQVENLATKIENIELTIQEQLDAAEEQDSAAVVTNNEVLVDVAQNQVNQVNQVNESNEITAKTMAGVKELASKMPSMEELSKTANTVKNDAMAEATKVAGTVAAATTVAAGTVSAAASSAAATATAAVTAATAKATEEVAKLSTKLASKELEQVEIPKATTEVIEEQVVEQAAPEPGVKAEPAQASVEESTTAELSSPENTAETLDATTVMPELAAKIEEIEGKNSEPVVVIPSATTVQEQVSSEEPSAPAVASTEINAKAEGTPKKKSKTPFIIAAAVAAILIGGGAGYYVISDNKPATPVVEEQKPAAEEPAKDNNDEEFIGDAKSARTQFSVGGLSIGDDKAKMIEIFGNPPSPQEYEGTYDYGNFIVVTDANNKVTRLDVKRKGYMTKNGLYVGMPINEAIKVFGEDYNNDRSLDGDTCYEYKLKDGDIPMRVSFYDVDGKVGDYFIFVDTAALKEQEEAKKKAAEEAKAKQQAQQQQQQQVTKKSGGSSGGPVDVNGAIAAVRNHFGGKASNIQIVSTSPDFVVLKFNITKRVSRGYGKFDNQVISQTAGVAKRGGGWSISYVQ